MAPQTGVWSSKEPLLFNMIVIMIVMGKGQCFLGFPYIAEKVQINADDGTCAFVVSNMIVIMLVMGKLKCVLESGAARSPLCLT